MRAKKMKAITDLMERAEEYAEFILPRMSIEPFDRKLRRERIASKLYDALLEEEKEKNEAKLNNYANNMP